MHVEALQLRYRGIPQAEETLRETPPITGRLQYSAASGNLLLMPLNPEDTEPIVQLFKCKLKLIERRGMVYVGTEDIWKRKERTSYPQALWCWPAPPSSVAVARPGLRPLLAGA